MTPTPMEGVNLGFEGRRRHLDPSVVTEKRWTLMLIVYSDHSYSACIRNTSVLWNSYCSCWRRAVYVCEMAKQNSRWGNEKNLFHDYTSRQPSAVALNIHVNMPGWGIQFLSTIIGPVSAPFPACFGPNLTIVGLWQCVHLKDQVLSFKTNGHLWKSVKNWLQKWAKSNAISKHVAFSLANISEMPIQVGHG